MKNLDKYVGLHVHKDTTVIAVAEAGRTGEVRLYGTIRSDLGALEKVLRKLGGDGVTLHVVYEAGPTGYVVYRRLRQLKIACIVVAPTKTPQPKGVRQKTDRRDAEQLARLHRAGELTAIHVPDAGRRIDPGSHARPGRRGARSDAGEAAVKIVSPAPGLPLLRQGELVGGAPAVSARTRAAAVGAQAVLEECLLAIDQWCQRRNFSFLPSPSGSQIARRRTATLPPA